MINTGKDTIAWSGLIMAALCALVDILLLVSGVAQVKDQDNALSYASSLPGVPSTAFGPNVSYTGESTKLEAAAGVLLIAQFACLMIIIIIGICQARAVTLKRAWAVIGSVIFVISEMIISAGYSAVTARGHITVIAQTGISQPALDDIVELARFANGAEKLAYINYTPLRAAIAFAWLTCLFMTIGFVALNLAGPNQDSKLPPRKQPYLQPTVEHLLVLSLLTPDRQHRRIMSTGYADIRAELPAEPRSWRPSQLAQYLGVALKLPERLHEDIEAFVRTSGLSGARFLRLSPADLDTLGVNVAWRAVLLDAREQLRSEGIRGRICGFGSTAAFVPQEPNKLADASARDVPVMRDPNSWQLSLARATRAYAPGRIKLMADSFATEPIEDTPLQDASDRPKLRFRRSVTHFRNLSDAGSVDSLTLPDDRACDDSASESEDNRILRPERPGSDDAFVLGPLQSSFLSCSTEASSTVSDEKLPTSPEALKLTFDDDEDFGQGTLVVISKARLAALQARLKEQDKREAPQPEIPAGWLALGSYIGLASIGLTMIVIKHVGSKLV
ncbi:uncharacterized protein L969DRAFT_105444 [Mixia osmundae IAM 14324]|uniref:SAM domain-containing protein n=1 Tax=Mixia osmundae (strain CBS 9802 / IAM 14324 / JCM 22182 / KY 12970) TaxID=764103 RepID=G7DZM7_MIXOS|nr:uncharacterized protein L969DRAFT_105444 [Mixia osmundae IAM 14324]KEI37199.1 hypothetical protein L969DRAFT_105444 [Mixia osmundae IAM 14324]GAA96037.1 hypothetical protein E5Q_02697 [Mixia osmundae IAM 14324]